MRSARRERRGLAFTLLEVLCVVAIIGLLVALLLPVSTQAKARAHRVQSVNCLRPAGLAFQSFAQDHNGQFPIAVPANQGGSLELAQDAHRPASPTLSFPEALFVPASQFQATPQANTPGGKPQAISPTNSPSLAAAPVSPVALRADNPSFSLFPAWLALVLTRAAETAVWLLLCFLFLLAAATLARKHLPAKKKDPPKIDP